jgi:serine/threonine protein kinase/formylglycine-generating enzyme required for sulfatase activity
MKEKRSKKRSQEKALSTEALTLFEAFLLRFHEGGVGSEGLETLCETHPQFAERFQKWWGRLLEAGEVSDSRMGDGPGDGEPLPGQCLGPYRILRELGRGSQGAVYLAEDTELGRRVALKILPQYRRVAPGLRGRFAREAELASKLDHPGLCTIYERGSLKGVSYLAMRYIEGESLAKKIAARKRQWEEGMGLPGPSEIDGFICCFESIAEALHVAHESGLIHRDIKPGNILIDDGQNPVLVDFGLAREIETESSLTMTGDLVGTPAYISPEQLASGRIPLDPRSDVYSLTATFYECLTLNRVFEEPTRNQLYQKILSADPIPARSRNPAISRDMEVVLQTGLAKDRENRYQTAKDFAEDLRRVREHQPIRARPAGPLLRFRKWAQRNPATALSFMALFMALSISLGISLAWYAQTRKARAAVNKLADRVVLEALEKKAKKLQPIRLRLQPQVKEWVAQASSLLGRLSEHRRALAALRTKSLPYGEEDKVKDRKTHPRFPEYKRLHQEIPLLEERVKSLRTPFQIGMVKAKLKSHRGRIEALRQDLKLRRTYAFASLEDQVAHDALWSLVEDLERFAEKKGLFEQMQEHLAWLDADPAKVLPGYAEAWEKVRNRIAENPRYKNQNLPIQEGLFPLGLNPNTQLEEFLHLRSSAPSFSLPKREAGKGTLQLKPSHGIVFVLLPPAEFQAGSLRASPTPVSLQWFFLSAFELNRAQFERLSFAPIPSSSILASWPESGGSNLPVESISWDQFHSLLSVYGLTIPTEIQWEYGARGNTRTRWWWGNKAPNDFTGAFPDNLRDRSFEAKIQGRSRLRWNDTFPLLAPVHSGIPNPFGLHLLYGNVAEWCREPFLLSLRWDSSLRPGDGFRKVPFFGLRAIRGGRFNSNPNQISSWSRMGRQAKIGHLGLGVRPARRVE